MATRTPLYVNSDNDLQEMTSTMINEIIAQVSYQYSLNPSVTLSRVASGGSLGTINDTRKKAGAYQTRVDRYPTEAELAEPGTVTVGNAKISQTVATVTQPADTNSIAFPCYQSSGDIQSMTYTDMVDTFIHPAIDNLVSGSTGTAQGGTYTIATSSSLSGATLVSSSSVFVDTRANTSLYTGGGIPEALDQPQNIQQYYLHVIDGAAQSYTAPVYIRSDNNLQTFTDTAFNTLLQNFVRYEAASSSQTYRIRYSYSTGTNRGSGMTDTRLNGSGNRQTRFVNANDYRAQEFPNGSATTIATHNLKIAKSS